MYSATASFLIHLSNLGELTPKAIKWWYASRASSLLTPTLFKAKSPTSLATGAVSWEA